MCIRDRYDIPENGSFTAKYNKDQTEYTIYNASEKEVCNFVVDLSLIHILRLPFIMSQPASMFSSAKRLNLFSPIRKYFDASSMVRVYFSHTGIS